MIITYFSELADVTVAHLRHNKAAEIIAIEFDLKMPAPYFFLNQQEYRKMKVSLRAFLRLIIRAANLILPVLYLLMARNH